MEEELKQIKQLLEKLVELQEETLDWVKKIYKWK